LSPTTAFPLKAGANFLGKPNCRLAAIRHTKTSTFIKIVKKEVAKEVPKIVKKEASTPIKVFFC